MSQSSERVWREGILINMQHKSNLVPYGSHSICIYAFGVIVGGPTYQRVCFSSIKHLRQAKATPGTASYYVRLLNNNIVAGDKLLPYDDRVALASSLTLDSSLAIEIIQELTFIINVLGDYHPVTGQLQLDTITFSEVWEIYQAERVHTILSSRSQVRRLWTRCIDDLKVSIREKKTISKCSRCIELRSEIKLVCFLCSC